MFQISLVPLGDILSSKSKINEKEKIINYLFIIFFFFQTSQYLAKINNSVVITVGNLPITYLDLVKK